MKGKFSKKRSTTSAEISTASMPDIIFILLFFFMVATVMRENTLLVKNTLPEATEVTKVQDRKLVAYIYVGKPMKKEYGTTELMQLDDSFREVGELGEFISDKKGKLLPSEKSRLKVVLKSDIESKVGLMTDIKQELRKSNALKLTYATRKVETLR